MIYTENGTEVAADIEVAAGGPAPYCYSVAHENGAVTVRCWEGSAKPLVITISCNGLTITRQIQLRGLQ